jgi:hypothetical protein
MHWFIISKEIKEDQLISLRDINTVFNPKNSPKKYSIPFIFDREAKTEVKPI